MFRRKFCSFWEEMTKLCIQFFIHFPFKIRLIYHNFVQSNSLNRSKSLNTELEKLPKLPSQNQHTIFKTDKIKIKISKHDQKTKKKILNDFLEFIFVSFTLISIIFLFFVHYLLSIFSSCGVWFSTWSDLAIEVRKTSHKKLLLPNRCQCEDIEWLSIFSLLIFLFHFFAL